MKRKIISILLATTMTVSTAVGVFAADGTTTATDVEAFASMSTNDKTDFINANLSVRLQHLSRLASITSNQALDKLEDEIKSALADGLTAVEIKEAIYHSGAYCGFTRAAASLDKADEILESLGEDITYKSRITSTEETRYDDGLAVQRFLFGPQIGTIVDGTEESLKMQTLFLSGICFGDFYNRVGLPLYEREFITLCTIAGNGNCRGQLGGHVNGNLNVGHPKDMLRAAMLYNEDINGKEKTNLVLDVIDTTETEVNENPTEERPQPTTAIKTEFESDSEELLSLMEHFKADDKDNYIGRNIDSETQEILIAATEAVINGTDIPSSDNTATQILIDIAVMAAQGGRESELDAKIADGYNAGLSNDNMLAVPLLTAPYNGFPRTLNMRNSLSAVIDVANTDVKNTETANTVTETTKTTVTMQIGNSVMTVNGKEQNIDAEGTTPVVLDNRTLMPVRAFIEAIDGTVDWDGNSHTATLKYSGNEIKLTINSTTAYLNNQSATLDVAPVIINGRTMLPIRFIAESFGYTVLWSKETQTVTIINADKIDNVFAKGDINPASPKFTGVSYMNWLTAYDEENMKIPAFGQVTFEPCTRTDWHYHDGGQILLVTEGVGVFEMEGENPRIMQAGDVILIPPGKKHMHSAINDSWFAHIAIGVNPGVGTTNWLDKVTDEEYNKAVKTARANGTIREKGETMFPKGEEFVAEGYTGKIYKNILVEHESVFNCPEVDNYTMETGARTDWHSHESGQLIIVTNGTGLYQEEGGNVRVVTAGDVIETQPGINHWHGAANEQFAYIAVNGNPGNDKVTWRNAVTDEEYNSVKAGSNIAVTDTENGKVQGYIHNDIYTYHGIPYAQATERFVPAEKVKNWNGIKTAYSYGEIAMQSGNYANMDENCQNLNIWTPSINDGKKRPVMVWLHGGGFSTGSSIESPAYDGENLSKKGDIVVVSVNHRLNSLGHLDLSSYGEKYKYSANVGMTDIIASLEWIRDNIEQFGGDPNNVTVFGESGGGAKVLALMTSPYAKGLFHKGIVESGATENMGAKFNSLEASKRVTEITLENLGIKPDEIEKLQTISYEDLTKASDKALTQAAEELNIYEEFVNGYSLLWEPVVDGDFLPTSPVTENGFAEAGKDIPLLIGSNLNEWTVFGNPMANPEEKLSSEELDKRLKEKYGDNADNVKNEFKKAYPNESDTASLFIDTTLIRLPILKLTAHKADQNVAPVYSYMFTWGTSYHTAEIPFVFSNIDKSQPSGDIYEAEKLSDIMSNAWINFARTGNPNGDGIPNWEPYTRDGGATMIFDNESYLAHNYDKELMSILAPEYRY